MMFTAETAASASVWGFCVPGRTALPEYCWLLFLGLPECCFLEFLYCSWSTVPGVTVPALAVMFKELSCTTVVQSRCCPVLLAWAKPSREVQC